MAHGIILYAFSKDSRPATSEEALRMLNEVSDRLDGIRDQLAALEEQEKQVNLRLVEIKGEITLLNSAIQAAAGFCEPWKGYLAPYGTAKEANLAWTDAKTSFEEAEKMTLKRRKGVDTHVGKIRTLIYDERQSAADIQTTHQFRDQLNNLYRECDTVAEKLNDVIASMASRLSHFELNKKDIVDQLAFDCRDIIKRIEDINNVSKLPNMGTLWEIWRGRAFVKFDVRQEVKNEDYIRSRLEEYLLHLVRNEKDRLPSPMDLLFNALRYVLDNKYRVSTLRPFTNPTIKYYRISEKDGLGGWSGGERLTGAILFCLSLAELMRLHRHGTVKKSEAGFLLIDNPFGTTTSQDYINIQFALARRFNVQLIATTNIKQSDILASFPKIIGLKQIGVDKVSRDTYIAEATDSCPEIAEAYLKRRRNAAREAAA